jgi:O-antigen/teichoic acid export membrane protein
MMRALDPEDNGVFMLDRLSMLRLRGHAVTGLDQVLSSASNVLTVVLVGRASSADQFGRFALAYAVLTLVVTLNRAYLGNRVSLSSSDEQARSATATAIGGVLALAPAMMLAVWVVARISGGAGSLVLLVALAAPVICLQDLLRFGAVASHRPGVAVLSDGIWTAFLAVPLLLSVAPTPVQAVATWGVGAVVAAVVALARLGLRPRIVEGWRALRHHDPVGRSLVFGRLATTSASLIAISVSAAIIGATAAGSLRGASTLLGPLNAIFALVPLSLTPMLVRRPRSGDLKVCAAVALGLVSLVLVWGGALLLLLPPELGAKVLGSSWAGARSVLPFTVLEYCSMSCTAAILLAARLRGHARGIALQQTVLAVVTVVLGVGTAWLTHDVRYVAASFGLGSVASAVTGAVSLLRGSRRSAPVTVPA